MTAVAVKVGDAEAAPAGCTNDSTAYGYLASGTRCKKLCNAGTICASWPGTRKRKTTVARSTNPLPGPETAIFGC